LGGWGVGGLAVDDGFLVGDGADDCGGVAGVDMDLGFGVVLCVGGPCVGNGGCGGCGGFEDCWF